MIRALVIAIAALLLAACASNQLPAASAGSGAIAVGTLAPLASFEFEIAPQYTRAEVIAQQATRAVRAGHLDSVTAGHILRLLTAARADLNASVALELSSRDREAARRRAQPAVQSIDEAAALLRGQR